MRAFAIVLVVAGCGGSHDGVQPDGGSGSNSSDAGTDGGGSGSGLFPGDPPREGLCSTGGWCWQNPLPQGNDLADVWVGGGRVYMVGSAGTILTIDNTGHWAAEPSGTREIL